MREDWRRQRRWHLFKSATQRYVLSDTEEDCDWQCWTDSFPEFCLQILTRGIAERDCWIDEGDFTQAEIKKLSENMLDERKAAAEETKEDSEDAQSEDAK